ncbi:MAG: DUF4251 domain-containing protein [Prevotella sp.]|jgi:hypothetical protein|nr:DUF4251 domain-containing protein [Prevotella sp.]
MRTIITILLLVALGFGCKSGSSLTKEETSALMNEKIESSDYTFVAQTAIPMGGKSVNLNYLYSLKVSKDTVSAYLPYYGRAYTAPMPSEDGGIKFTSANFDYTVSEKKKGMRDVTIKTKDTQRRYDLILSIGDSGYATLSVNESNRQPITFYGKIE